VASIQERDLYVGPAPVTLEDYCEMVRLQSIRGRRVTMDQVRDVLADLVISDPLLRQLGPACNSGQSMFLYGHPGNGKTLIAERLSRLSDRPVAIPYAVEADNQIIRLFDPMIHVPVGPEEGGVPDHLQSQFDGRWVLCRRPFVVVGGELRLEQLDLTYDPQLRYYVAPLQMRANGGAFLVDDFGRQRVPPEDLLNRWIVPLEKHVDFFTLSTGKQIEVPFEALLIFSTNLAPQELVDEAFLRRIRYKVEIKDPTEAEYREIFRRVCAQQRMAYDEEAVTYLINYHYFETRRELRACHPRDLVEQIVDLARFERTQPSLTHDLIDAACHTYFIEQ
jgi:predicted ATPase with chaperone activity